MEQLFVILRPKLKMYFSWIKLAARHPFSPVLNPGGSSPLTIRRSLAVRVSVLFESGIHRRLIGDNQLGGEHDDLERDCYEQLVDASLFVWLNAAGLRRERGTLFSPEWYIENVASNWLPMQQCVTHASMAVLMVDKLNTLDSKSLGLLSSSLQRQCLEWPMSFRKRYSEDPDAVDGSSFYSFVEVHHTVFMRAKKFAEISKSNSFPALALRGVGREFSDAPLTLPDGRRSTLGAHITAYYLSTIAFNAPDGALRLLSDLLHAGLLNFLLDTLARLPTGEEPFKSWQWKKRDPLERLFSTSHDLHISMALEAAKDEVPTSTLDAIAANPAAAQAWTMFNENIRPYQEALRRLPTSGRNVPLCDSFEHTASTQGPGIDHRRKCSWCHTVVYCSERCQRQDWESFHRRECADSRYRRIEQELQNCSISHRSRYFKLLHLESVLNDYIRTSPHPRPGHQNNSWPNGKSPVYIVTTFPAPMTVRRVSSKESEAMGYSLNDVDDRCRAIIKESEADSNVVFAVSIATFGSQVVLTFGRFSHQRSPVESDGSQVKLSVLNGFVKVLPLTDIKAG
ncbi:hypothetical protein DFP72DRAFT_407077 [Ephemerocybe angulata]|uniref:MYND-type domain-containing protein n=1 Tax=Ephemerocybe angulata TaxID=980116 RepID=A0A8H6HV99_9AGAR|nr:hypothetical protein DFP72DRAFT_407077 [Tulosesus angulatus]